MSNQSILLKCNFRKIHNVNITLGIDNLYVFGVQNITGNHKSCIIRNMW